MYKRIPQSSATVLGYDVRGRLTQEEMLQLTRELERAIERSGRIRVLIDLSSFPYAETGAFWEDLRFDFRHRNDVERAAVIGDRAWQRWTNRLFGALSGAEKRHFRQAEAAQAWAWVRGAPRTSAPRRESGRAGERV
jgi:hypothetical protein